MREHLEFVQGTFGHVDQRVLMSEVWGLAGWFSSKLYRGEEKRHHRKPWIMAEREHFFLHLCRKKKVFTGMTEQRND
jgi:hypothetical protein